MPNSAELDAAITNWRAKRAALVPAIAARNSAQNLLEAAAAAFDALNIAGSTDTQVGDALKLVAQRQKAFNDAATALEQKKDELAAAREAMYTQARIDTGS